MLLLLSLLLLLFLFYTIASIDQECLKQKVEQQSWVALRGVVTTIILYYIISNYIIFSVVNYLKYKYFKYVFEMHTQYFVFCI